MLLRGRTMQACLLLIVASLACAQAPGALPSSLTAVGHVERDGKSLPYEIRHLPVSSFPDLPLAVAAELTEMACLIPQTYEARRPENVIHASLESAGSSDWAVLCSRQGEVSLLVFFGSEGGRYSQLATFSETGRLQKHLGTDALGFNWGIDPATPSAVHQAQTGLIPRPPRIQHDAISDAAIDQKTVYRYYTGGKWIVLDMPD